MEKKKTILIAEDNEDLARTLQDRLESVGYKTLIAQEGVRVIELAHKEKPDLIVLDLRMPAGSGQNTLHSLRSQGETREIPVIIVTGLTDLGLEDEAFDAGANDFFRKPYDEQELLKSIRRLLGES